MLSAHYRSPINYSQESLEQAKAALERLHNAENNMEFLVKNGSDEALSEKQKETLTGFDKYREKFINAMDDDINTADAIAAIFELVRDVNTALSENGSSAFAKSCLERVRELCDVLGIIQKQEEASLDAEVEEMIEKRQAARKAKNFAEADKIRDELTAMGIILEDTPQGVKWHRA